MKRVSLRLAAAGAGAAMLIAGCAGTSGKATTTANEQGASSAPASVTSVKLGIFPGTFLSMLPLVTQAQGFFEKNGLKVDLVPVDSGPQMTALLASHELNFVTNSIDNLAQARKQGLDPMVVAGNVTSSPFVVLAGNKVKLPHAGQYPAVIGDLKGLKWGVQARGGSTELILRDMASDAGLNPDKDVAWIGIGGPAKALPALQNGAIDVYIAFDPTQTVALANGFAKTVVDMTKGQGPHDFRNIDYNTIWALSDYLHSHQDVVGRFLKAELQATCWLQQPANLDALVNDMQGKISSTGLSDTQFRDMIKNDAAIVGATFRKSSIDNWNSFLVKYKLIDKPLTASDILWSQVPESAPC